MKKLLFTAIALVSLTLVSCRQEEEIMSSEDQANLKVLNDSSARIIIDSDSVNITNPTSTYDKDAVDGETTPPPRK